MAEIYDAHRESGAGGTGVRFFEQIENGLLGGHSTSELIGLSPVGVLVIDTSGQLEQVDSLRSVHHGAASVGLDVLLNSFDQALAHPGIVARQIGAAALSDDCLRCELHRVCGAGFYAHRFHPGRGYRSASVYCADLAHLIRHIARRMAEDLRSATARSRA